MLETTKSYTFTSTLKMYFKADFLFSIFLFSITVIENARDILKG